MKTLHPWKGKSKMAHTTGTKIRRTEVDAKIMNKMPKTTLTFVEQSAFDALIYRMKVFIQSGK